MNSRAIFLNPDTARLRSGWRIPALLLAVAPVQVLLPRLGRLLQPTATHPFFLPFKALMAAAFIGLCLGVYRLFARHVEGRRPSELTVDGASRRHAGMGLLMGGGVMGVIVGVLAITGCYHVAAVNGVKEMLRDLFFYLPQSFMEDFIFCLILYRLLREGLGRRAALLIAPLLFATAHMGNPNESPLGLIEIFTGGVLMYYAFERTGSFWTVWALHFSWNFTMNGIFGMANSGQDMPGLLKPVITGPAWLTGGATGPEASILAVGFDLLLFLVLWMASDRSLKARSFATA